MPPATARAFGAEIESLPLSHQGKVRDVYELDERNLLIVTSDRISAFDVVLDDTIPGKGRVLNELSNFWFARLSAVPNHLSGKDLACVAETRASVSLAARSVIVKKTTPLPVEAIVRGYLSGSAWKDYQASGRVCGIKLPAGLVMASPLPRPIFTPSTKAAPGEHDVNVGFEYMADALGRELAESVRDKALLLYHECARYARSRGIIIADTKFEFGLDEDGRLLLIDEVATPDSSRFWDLHSHLPGTSPPGFDKQFVRDYLETTGWDKTPPAPRLPPAVIKATAGKYRELQSRLMQTDG